MGLIHLELFATLDLVGQAPGSPDEDPVGFPYGGWQAPLMDDVTGAQVLAAYEGPMPCCSVGADLAGVGKKVFDDGVVPANLTLLEPPATGGQGTVLLRYGLEEGEPGTGRMG